MATGLNVEEAMAAVRTDTVFTTRRSPRATRLTPSSDSTPWAPTWRVSFLRSWFDRRRSLPDDARRTPPLPQGQCRCGTPRGDGAEDVGRCGGRGTDRGHHQRRPHGHLAGCRLGWARAAKRVGCHVGAASAAQARADRRDPDQVGAHLEDTLLIGLLGERRPTSAPPC